MAYCYNVTSTFDRWLEVPPTRSRLELANAKRTFFMCNFSSFRLLQSLILYRRTPAFVGTTRRHLVRGEKYLDTVEDFTRVLNRATVRRSGG